VSVGDFRGPSRTAIFNEGPSRMKRLLLGASAVIALSAGHAVRADDDYHFHDGNKNPAISYVRNSLAQSVILNGPWTLHESVANFIHDASGIVPPATQTAPPYTGTGTPYASYCNAAGKLAVNHGFSLMQPYYFPFVRRHGDILSPAQRARGRSGGDLDRLGRLLDFQRRGFGAQPLLPVVSL
jgi:hypothetical protein